MNDFAAKRREELYGSGRNQDSEVLRSVLTESHIFRNGEFNIDKNSRKPGFQWSTVTTDDYKTTLKAAEQGKQYDESYKQIIGSYIPIKHEGIPADFYTQTTSRDDYIDKGYQERREYIGNDSTTNWPDMTPRLIKDKKLGISEYKDIFTTEGLDYKTKPEYGKIDTKNTKLPVPYNERKHGINVSLGSDPVPVGLSSEMSSRYLKTNPKQFDNSSIKLMKQEMEWNSRVLQDGDYNETEPGVKQSFFDIDYGKRPRGDTQTKLLEKSQCADDPERLLDQSIQEKLHFIPQLIDGSMKMDTTRCEGDEGKKYHIHAHFNLGSHADKSMSTYVKDFQPFRPQMNPGRIKPSDANVINYDNNPNFKTTNSVDYYGGGEHQQISADNQAIRRANMNKQNSKHITFANVSDDSLGTVFTRDFRRPPSYYRPISPAKEKKCEFDFLESGGMLSNFTKRLSENTESKDNFRGTATTESKARIHSAAKRRLKSGRRAHFILGSHPPSYQTVTNDTFMGKPRNDDNVPAAGKVEKIEKVYPHFFVSDNTQDHISDHIMPNLQESRAAIDLYNDRKKPKDTTLKETVTKTEYIPISERSYTVPQLRQMRAEHVKGSKPVANTHYFHLDNSNADNYETTAMASFIKPELMSGKVHLSSLN